MSIKIIIAGPRGRMGSEAIEMVNKEPAFQLVGCIDRINNGKKISDIETLPNLDVPIFKDPVECFQNVKADVFIDLTVPDVGFDHTLLAIKHRIRPVVGTSGFTSGQIRELSDMAEDYGIGCIIAPNFAIGAVLMMQFSQMAAKYFPDVEIIEKHHDQKLDAPSGTAVKTMELINDSRNYKIQGHPDETESFAGARGAEVNGMHIHSVRLPGLVAHQEVIFGGNGQTLTIKHDSFNRASFMSGIKIAIEQVMELDKLVYGLENILDMK